VDRLALELVDPGLIFVSSRGRISTPSPGLAIVDGRDLLVGLDAARSARLKPRRLHSRFWEMLSDDPLARPFPSHLRSADLAHAHLLDLWETEGGNDDQIVIAVPSLYSKEQLGLLLGIADACHMPVRGMVDAAVAAAVDRPGRTKCLHLDIHLHRAVLTELDRESEIVRGAVAEESRVGLLGLYDTWARALAKIFVRRTRFDPMHRAATEQVLYVQLHNHLAALTKQGATTVAIPSGGRRHTIEVGLEDVVGPVRPAYQTLSAWVRDRTDSAGTTLLVSNRLAGLPGLATHLRDSTETEVIELHPAAAASGALAHYDQICSSDRSLPFVTRLPAYDSRPAAVTVAVTPPSADAEKTEGPTHVVMGGVAHRISAGGIVLGSADSDTGDRRDRVMIRRRDHKVILEGPSSSSMTVNDVAVDGATVLTTGDRVRPAPDADEALLVTMVE
jgi:hypothetical protein